MLRTETVDLGGSSIDIPIAKIEGKYRGKTIVITGGMDGDEYAGIEAAYRLITWYQNRNFHGTIFILPLMNILGFDAHTSLNPLDGKYPKDVFPGKPYGSPTERLIHWLYTHYIINADIWVDLHSGSSTEKLHPFVWTYETKNKTVDHAIHTIIARLPTQRIIFQRHSSQSKASQLAQKQIAYVMLEAGELGKKKEENILQLIRWVKKIVVSFTQLDYSLLKTKNVYTAVQLYYAKQEGIWHAVANDSTIEQKTYLGEITSVSGNHLQKVIATTQGIFLWRKDNVLVKKRDILFAIASSPKPLF